MQVTTNSVAAAKIKTAHLSIPIGILIVVGLWVVVLRRYRVWKSYRMPVCDWSDQVGGLKDVGLQLCSRHDGLNKALQQDQVY